MKKYLIVSLSVMVVLAFAATSFALHATPEGFEYTPSVVKAKKAQLEFSGHIRVRGEMADTDFNDTNSTNKASYDYRGRLGTKVTLSPNTMGMIEFETGNQKLDATTEDISGTDAVTGVSTGGSSQDSVGWGGCSSGALGVYKESNCKPTTATFRQLYVAHQGSGLTGSLAGFKAGHMLLSLGNGLFYNHTQHGDDAVVLWTTMGGSEVSFTAIKLDEDGGGIADDADAYVLAGEIPVGGMNLSGDVTFVNDNANRVDLWNIGVRGDFNMDGIKLKADVEFQTGDVENGVSPGVDLDLEGLAFLVSASTNVGDMKIMAEAAYGSGNDINDTGSYDGFITSQSAGERYTYLYDQKTMTSATAVGSGATALAGSNSGISNTWYIGLGASTKVNPDLKAGLDVFYLQAAEKVSNTTGFDSKDIGIEVDTHIDYQIDTNLVWYLEAGYLFADDFFRNVTGSATGDVDDAYSVRHGVIVKF